TIIGLGYVISYNVTYNIPFTNIVVIPTLTGTAFIIIMAFIIRNLPVGIRSGISSLQQIDPSIEEAAHILGASSSTVIRTVTIPMIKDAFFSGLIYSFARSMTLVSTIIFLISAKWKLLTPAIMNNIDTGRIGVASAYCTILIVIVSFVMFAIKLTLDFKKTGAE
uniref:ABC transporter permease subunit n=1 Tax=uncultured Cetobacterium sp. TaxID=527638 RepID=UPI002637822B